MHLVSIYLIQCRTKKNYIHKIKLLILERKTIKTITKRNQSVEKIHDMVKILSILTNYAEPKLFEMTNLARCSVDQAELARYQHLYDMVDVNISSRIYTNNILTNKMTLL